MRAKKRFIIISIISLLLILIIYLVGVWFYKNHLFRDTVINHYSLSNMSVNEAESTFINDVADHQIKIIEKERTEVLSASKAGVTIDVGSQIKDLKSSQNYWKWPLHFFGKSQSSIHLTIDYDKHKTANLVHSLECLKAENITPPENARIEAGDQEFIIIPETMGNKVKEGELLQNIEDAFSTYTTEINLEKENLYEIPEYYAKDALVNDALETANKYSHATITYDYGYTKEVLDYQTIKKWIQISKKFKVSLNEDLVGDYVADMQKEYNTMGTARKFKTVSGKEITIIQGDYGWKINFKKEKEKLLKDTKSGQTTEREPEWEYRGLVRKGKRADIGGTYVEVSIDQQTVWMFVDGKPIASSSCCTGNPNKNASTTKGIYSITFKKSPATLTGPDAEGGHYSSDVTYWMPFNGNQGLHDAPWRSAFGGNIYKTNGTHGCVNLPFSMAKIIWDNVKEGYPVIVY